MNDMSLPAIRPQVQEFFTAAELAKLAKRFGYKAFPHSESGAIRFAKRGGWNDMPPSRCRKRTGKEGGGGLEYHITLIPRLESLLATERTMQADKAASRVVSVVNSDEPQPAASEGQRKVANARGQVLTAIIAYASRRELRLSRAIADFVLAQEGHEAWLHACQVRDTGEFLTLEHKLKIKEGSPMVALPPVDDPEKSRTEDHRFPFGFGVSEGLLAQANSRPRKGGGFQKVSRSTLYDWLKSYQERGLAALAPAATKTEEPIPADFWRFMQGYACPAKPKIAEIHTKYLSATPHGIQPLSLNQVEYILRVKLDHLQKNKGREGRLALRARMAFVRRDTSELLPGMVYVGDGHAFDARVEDPGGSRAPMRPEISPIMDVATRRVVGWAISRKENVIAVTEALRNACMDHGIPAVVYFDRGSGYKNKRFDDAGNGLMARLDITKAHALPYGSQAKGNIERLHQTIWIPFARELSTYLGDDMDKEARMRIDKQIKADRREFGYSKLLMPWAEFRQECQRRIDEYNDRPHSELPRFVDPETGRVRFMSPNEYWQSFVDRGGFEPVLVDPFSMDDLFRPYEKRTVHRCLIELWTNEYFSLDLNPYHKQEVYVGYDYNQADRVWVREIDTETREVGKLICVAAYGGNKVSYMPKTFLESAVERREKGRLKRNERNREGILEERNAPLVLDHQPTGPVIDMAPLALPEAEPLPLRPSASRSQAAQINPDAELALQCLTDPSQLTPGRVRLLRDVMASRAGQEVLRNSGVDLTMLDDLLRSAA